MFSEAEIKQLNSQFENQSSETILLWAWKTFGSKVAATSSFQSQSIPLLYLISQTVPEMPILFLDTGFHFPETLSFRDLLIKELGINVKALKNEIGRDGFIRKHGELFQSNPDLCCFINKVEPLKQAKKDLDAWITGIRRDQTSARSKAPIVSIDDGLIKICPMVNWTKKDIWRYIHVHELPEHPLLSRGYLSVGCQPCTRPVGAGEDERAGRWAGQTKTECGIHISIPVDKET